MATFIKLKDGVARAFVTEANKRQELADYARMQEYKAAVIIQSWYRSLRTRHYLRYLHSCAVVVQKHWRGYLGRKFARIRVRNLVMIMQMNLYNAMAVRIQKRWRGYFVRKYTHNFYARKRYLEALAIKNQIVRSELEEYKEQAEMERRRQELEKAEKDIQMLARRNHYLVSTIQRPGIYNSPYREFPQDMEFRLRAVKPLPPPRIKRDRLTSSNIVDPTPLLHKPNPPKDGLPPIQTKKIQGPFKSLDEVQKQRYKPLNPSLRVATEYECLEQGRDIMKRTEWANRLQDTNFVPFTKTKYTYEPLLHTATEYGHIDYGNKFFVEERKDKHISQKRMRTLVSPIPFFDKLGKTYTKGAVITQ